MPRSAAFWENDLVIGRLSIEAPAKLNLALAVAPAEQISTPFTGKVGWHQIASWFVPIELCDVLTLDRRAPGAGSEYIVEWLPDAPRPTPIDWPADKDLAARAHRLLEQVSGRELPVRLHVGKRVPVGGGLGGGSSDAAAALVGLDRLFQLRIPAAELVRLSASLGSDVAFFLDDPSWVEPAVATIPTTRILPRPAMITGFGDHIERLPIGDPVPVLLLVPAFGCPTKDVYSAFDATSTRPMRESAVRALIARQLIERRVPVAGLFNDLARPACEVAPGLGGILDRVNAALGPLGPGLRACVTGSGSTMFVVLPDQSSERGQNPGLAESVVAAVAAAEPSLVLVLTRLWSS